MPEACPFTSAAVACEIAVARARGWAQQGAELCAIVDSGNTGTVAALLTLRRDSERIIHSLEWLREFAIKAAMYPEEITRFVDAISSGKTYEEAERAALPSERRRRPATVPVPSPVAVLDQMRARA